MERTRQTGAGVEKLPTFTQYFDKLVSQKKQQIHKASDEDAFDAAVEEIGRKMGCRPNSGFSAYQKRKNARKHHAD
ncbi:hypothetical protein GCM10027299_28950 [Larkinella ripae]